MEITIDASAIIAVIVQEPQRDVLIERTKGTHLLTPHSVHWEIGNAFSAMLKRKRITLAQALQAIKVYQQIPIRAVDIELTEALTIAAQMNIYAYDAYLIRCALKYNAPLLTLDKGLLQSAREMAAPILEVS